MLVNAGVGPAGGEAAEWLGLVPAPGHTPGRQVVVTDRAVLGGDVQVGDCPVHKL